MAWEGISVVSSAALQLSLAGRPRNVGRFAARLPAQASASVASGLARAVRVLPILARTTLAQDAESRHSRRVTSPIVISIPHQLGRAEARRRIEHGFGKIVRLLPGSRGAPSERWEGDRLVFSVGALGQSVSGVIHVLDAAVTMEIELPGLIGLVAGGLKQRLQKMGQLLLTKK